ncbi:MAG: hypothetical protein KAT68_08790 [Bacteroidales bacterium]|nr:hypothetical protein [Bacteroidales bacterium]
MGKSSFQIFIENLVLSSLTILKVLLLSKFFIKFPQRTKCNNCIILGNGPSLNKVISNEIKLLSKNNLFCVNYFVYTDYFSILKPQYYVINAPELWGENVLKKVKNNSEKLFSAIGKKTKWEMILFLPYSAKKNQIWRNYLGDNNFIKICYFNTTPVEGFSILNNFFFKHGFGMPRPHNVLIPSLILSIGLNYRNIYLLGIDHSWLKEISVDKNNNVFINQKHFYDENSSEPKAMHKGGIGKRRLHEVLQKYVYSFRGYFEIKKFADKKNINIYNCTRDSYVDAFERKNLSELN